MGAVCIVFKLESTYWTDFGGALVMLGMPGTVLHEEGGHSKGHVTVNTLVGFVGESVWRTEEKVSDFETYFPFIENYLKETELLVYNCEQSTSLCS